MELKDYGRWRKDSELKIQSHDNPSKTKVQCVGERLQSMLFCVKTPYKCVKMFLFFRSDMFSVLIKCY